MDSTIEILIDEQGHCEFIKIPDRWHRCKLSNEQIKAIMDILKNAEKEKKNNEV